MTQALPLPVTALVPLALFPVLGRENDDSASDVMQDIGASYGNPIIFLFLGGVMLALAMQRWNLHKRLALLVIRAIGTKPNRMIAGFMIATALVSMWVSNTATAVMMLPIGVSVLLLVAKSTTLTSDAAANGTTKPQGDGDGLIGDTGGAIRTNFGTALMLGIAIVVALLLFILPAGAEKGVRLLDWKTAGHLPWGVLLFGGGLALSSQFTASGLSAWIGEQVEGLAGVPVWLIVVLITGAVLVLTELSSNTATAATLLPVVGGVSIGLGVDPLLLAFPVAVAATCSFMLPVATPPNAIAYGSGYVTAGQMIKGGFWLNVIALGLVSVATLTLATWVFGIVW